MKKFLATAAFIATSAVSSLVYGQTNSEPHLMEDSDAKNRIELSNRDNFLEAVDNGDGSATVILVGQDPHWGMPGDPRSELHIRIEDTNNDGHYTAEDKATHFNVIALQKTARNRRAVAESGVNFKKFALNKTAILDVQYHENMITQHDNVAPDGDAYDKKDTRKRRRDKKAISHSFVTEANMISVVEDTFGVPVDVHVHNVQAQRAQLR